MNIRTQHAASVFRLELCGLWRVQYVWACSWSLKNTVTVEAVDTSSKVFYLLTLLEVDPMKGENHEAWLL